MRQSHHTSKTSKLLLVPHFPHSVTPENIPKSVIKCQTQDTSIIKAKGALNHTEECYATSGSTISPAVRQRKIALEYTDTSISSLQPVSKSHVWKITCSWDSCLYYINDDAVSLIEWRHQMEIFPRYCPFVRGIHFPRSPVISLTKAQ